MNTRITELDFDQIKNNFKDYLASQTQFKDYNFEGSGLNILLDVLAYNTHYQSFYANMVSNEMFLDSAVLRDSVVSIAKHLGYTTRSTRAATATVNVSTVDGTVEVPATDPGTLEKGSVFETKKDNITYYFTSVDNVKYAADGLGNWVARDVEIKEGQMTSSSYIMNSQDKDQKYIIPSNTIDTSTIEIRVQTSITDQSGVDDPWLLSSDFNILNSNSQVYFLQEVENGQFEIYFGDGMVGRSPVDGNLITVTYISTNGAVANNIGNADSSTNRSFTYVNQPIWDTSVITSSVGGEAPETIESIKYMAPRFYQSQGRAVTIEDYKTIITSQFSDIESVYVWGGEDNDPPVYGKVFLSVKPISGVSLSPGQKLAMQQELKRNKAMAGILPEVIDPDYNYIKVGADVYYNPDNTGTSATTIKQNIIDNILNYGDTQLEKFERDLRFKDLINLIEDTDIGIVKSNISLQLEKRLVPVFSAANPYTLIYGNALFHPHDGHESIMTSSEFTYVDGRGNIRTNAYLKDDGKGRISTMYTNNKGKARYVVKEQGTISYDTGKITLDNFFPIASSLETYIKICVVPAMKNLSGLRNQILIIDKHDSDSTDINVIQHTSYENSINSVVGNTPQSS